MSSLGSRLRAAREKKGWSQTYVCQKLGISNSTLSGYERDYREPDAEMITIFAELYEVSTDELLGISSAPQSKKQETRSLGRAYYGGGDDWTEEEKALADAFIKTLRERRKSEKEE